MSYYGGTIELESAEWNDKKAVEYELAQAAWGMRLNVWYDLFHWNKNIVCADKRAAIDKLASMPDWNGVLYHMDVPDTAAIKRLAAAERKAEERYREVCAATDRPVVASGGVTTLDDVRALMDLVPIGVEGAIAGTALYEGRFTLQDALALTLPEDRPR